MASSVHGMWAIDIGSCSFKAIRISPSEEGLEVIGFDYLEHDKILSVAGVSAKDRHDSIAATLRQFLTQNDVGKEPVAISIAGQNSFARFTKLPPVEKKKIPEVVQFEAVQQIPFDINEVEWDWQLMETSDSPDAKVGLFAIKNELIGEILDHFTRDNVRVTTVQIAPMALYNYILYEDRTISAGGNKATVILDMGAENTTVVICTDNDVWQRNIRIGGNSFTQAIADAFKVPFEKAEKLKRTAPMSKYMRQIYTAMKPVYTELSGELSRSLGFYTSSGPGRGSTFSKIIAVGGGMKLQGLTKYLGQSLGIAVIKPESFDRLKPAASVSAAKFHENLCDFGVAYGLGVQLCGQARIQANLLPSNIARQMAWTRKARLFTAAAGILLLITLLTLGVAYRSWSQYQSQESVRNQVNGVLSEAQAAIDQLNGEEAKNQPLSDQIQKQFDLFKYREIVPQLNETILECFPNKNNTPDQAALFEAFEQGNAAGVAAIPRGERKQLFITRMMVHYTNDLEKADFPDPSKSESTMDMGGVGMGSMMMDPVMDMDSMMMGPDGMGEAAAPVVEKKSGFVVVIEGYTPYRQILDMIDPTGVSKNVNKWGIVSRFENLAKTRKNFPFEMYKKDSPHFKTEWGLVEYTTANQGGLQKTQPAGIGIPQEQRRIPETAAASPGAPAGTMMMDPMMMGGGVTGPDRLTTEWVLLDPMTGEEISKTYDLITPEDLAKNAQWTEKDLGRKEYDQYGKEKFIERDWWFRVQVKFVWKGAPKVELPAPTMQGMTPTGM